MRETFRQLDTASRLVGRRTALRYGLIGLASAAFAITTGCGSTSPASQSVAAFVRGTWRVTFDNGSFAETTLTIDDGTYKFADDESDWAGHSGAWAINGSTLTVDASWNNVVYSGDGIPSEIGDDSTATVTWSGSRRADKPFSAPITWDGDTLTSTGHKHGSSGSGTGKPIVTATRASSR